MLKKTAAKALKDTVPVLIGYLVLGFGFGILLQDRGYNFCWAFLMSLTIYGGSMQYAAVDLLSGGATLITTALMTIAINARHFFYGLSLLDKYKDTGKFKPYLIFSLTDETYSLICSSYVPKEMSKKKYYFFVSLFDQIYWIAGSVLGGIFGSVVSFNSAGVEFSMTALFVVIFVDQWLNCKNHFPAVTGAAASAVCLLIFGADGFIIPSMAVITAVLSFAGRKERAADGK